MDPTAEKRAIYQDNMTSAARLQNFVQELADDIRAGNTQVRQESMAQTDALFAVDAILGYLANRAEHHLTKEKKRHLRRVHSKAMFLARLEQDGGVYSSAKAAEVLGRTKTTVKNWKDSGQLLAVEIDGEFFYPAFQFTDDERISDRGVLKGLSGLLKQLKNCSDRIQYSFFVEERNTVLKGLSPAGCTFSVIEILKEDPDDELMAELHRLARVYGTQDAA
ncbi:hypothetical protein [Cedecea sp. NFIX57]|uniref:hypothetical protein n=1 Tax=Cedecea sp. NFIX57 TaxID=1566286 RepID=UPI000A0C282D|nr:hypothetical protein [Cedecea sp. NFIX57]SMG60631.1 hypothetical protein SAMN03159353_103814 [Cedecea sp. NFIX57]